MCAQSGETDKTLSKNHGLDGTSRSADQRDVSPNREGLGRIRGLDRFNHRSPPPGSRTAGNHFALLKGKRGKKGMKAEGRGQDATACIEDRMKAR